MKTKFKLFILSFLAVFTFYSCQDNDDTSSDNTNLEINDFIWKGLNLYYLWQADVPNLSDKKFPTQIELNNFLNTYPKPEALFESLLYKPESQFPEPGQAVDRFSWIVSDYLELEGMLQGTTNNNGVDFGLKYKPGSKTEIFGWVRYIIPNSDASTKNIKRGDIFNAVNGTQLTVSNYQSLLLGSNNDYTLNLADYNGGAITPNGKSIALTKTVLDENPIFIKVIVSGSHKIGYLLYNGFYANYDMQLNNAFGSLKSEGITDLVLDLRYNSGGSVQTATRLASMITGQFTGQIFAKEQWNAKIQSYYESNDPESLKNLFTDKMGTAAINSLNMSKIYILTSSSTASASELIINGLKPHISVVQIGDVTTGKNVGSVTLYDSPSFGKEKRNPNHRYAMQPLVLKIVNSAGFGDYQNGLNPDYQLKEDIGNLDVLGSSTELLLGTAINKITGTTKMKQQKPGIDFATFKDSKSINGVQNQMYIDKAPEGLLKTLE